MFFRQKRVENRTYLQIVENHRDGAKTRQKVIVTLGRLEDLHAKDGFDKLIQSGARFSQHLMLLSALKDGSLDRIVTRRIGPPLLFGRLWETTGIKAVIETLRQDRAFEFPLERTIFTTVLHRLMTSGSDRACDHWRHAYRIEGAEDLQLHHFYRAMAWLGEELDEEEQETATHVPRCTKDLIEEQLFDRRRDLFTDLALVFLDTTTLYFTGEGGESLGRRGKSKDHRPDLMQMLLAVVMDGDGRPVCTEMWPGNTADVTALLPIIDRLRSRFAIGRVCVIADRGMISKATMQGLEERKLDYILGARERSDTLIGEVVLKDKKPFAPLNITKAKGQAALRDGKQPRPQDETQLWVKEVMVGATRYIVCRNELEANKDAADRAAVLEALEQQLKQGDKALVGNSAYRRFLKAGGKKSDKVFQIDPGKVADEARFDGIFVLRTNTRISPLQAVLRYRDLLQVESLFRDAKALLSTRPIFHASDAAIRGHVFCSFLALVLKKNLADRCAAKGFKPEWDQAMRDLDRLEEITVADQDRELLLRTDADGSVPALFRSVGVALPPRLSNPKPPPESHTQSAPKRRGRPRRGATRT
jgi:transposase